MPEQGNEPPFISDEDRRLIALGRAVETFTHSPGKAWVVTGEGRGTTQATVLLDLIHERARITNV